MQSDRYGRKQLDSEIRDRNPPVGIPASGADYSETEVNPVGSIYASYGRTRNSDSAGLSQLRCKVEDESWCQD